MKKIYVFIGIVFISTNLFSQTGFSNLFDSIFVNLRYDTVSSGILHSKMIISLSDLERYCNTVDTTDSKHFSQVYFELQNTSVGENKIFERDFDEIRSSIKGDSNKINIGLLFSDIHFIDTNAFYNNRLLIIDSLVYVNDTNPNPVFKQKTLFLASPLEDYCEELSLNFTLNGAIYFRNTDKNISLIEIDFGDGYGYKSYSIGDNFEILENIIYSDYGEKIISVRAVTEDQDTLISISTFKIVPKTTIIYNYNDYDIVSDIPYLGVYGEAKLRIYYNKKTNKLQKPILIVDGFDPGDTRGFASDDKGKGGIWGLLSYDSIGKNVHIGDRLLDEGYDLAILNFSEYGNNIDGGADYIQRNALTCVKAIDSINILLAGNNSKEQLVIIGPSMGGQITRYALKYIENNLDDFDYRGHNTRLWVSLDSPHQGANIPLGAQGAIKYFVPLSGDARSKYNKIICSQAAKQMLLFHHTTYNSNTLDCTQDPLFTAYYNEINSLGFPKNLRKVAVTNGSLNGTRTGKAEDPVFRVVLKSPQSGVTAFFLNWISGMYPLTNDLAKIKMSPQYGADNKIVFEGIRYDVYQSSSRNHCSYDAASGGTLDTYHKIDTSFADYAVFETYLDQREHCFIPTKSALAFTGNHKDLCGILNDRDLVATNEIPFDNYIGPIDANMEHVTFNQWIHAWVNKELDNYIVGERELSLCGGYEYTINNLSASDIIQWECSENLQILSDPRNHTLSVRALQLGNGWIRAINSPDYRQDTLAYYQIYVGSSEFISETETTANTVWNTDLNIGSDYTIKTGHTLTIQNTDISFATDIKIKVEPGAKLIIDNSTLTSYCSGQYWGGIEVQGQSHLPQTDVYQGYLEIKNSSIIQNAKNAITTWRSGDWNSMGGIVNVLGSTFKNNIKSIEFLSYKNMNQNNQEIDNVSSISKSNFIWDIKMYPHHKTSLNHVSLWDVRGVKFNGCIFSNEELKDEIIQNGIYAEDAGFKVLEAFTPPPVAILKGEFNKLSYGIRVENSNKPIIIRNTTFNNNFCGIFGVATNNMEIIKNDFDVLSVYNLRGQYPVETSYGIAIDNSTGYKIEENVFNGEVNKGSINTGLQVKNSGKNANNIRNNNFNNLYYSTIAIGENRGVNRLGEMVGLKYTCNDFRENKYGIIVKRDANIVQRSYGINLNQDGGDLSLSAENFFDRKDDEIDSDIWIEDNTNQYNYVCFLDNSSKEPLSISDNIVKYNATYSGNCSSNYDLLGNLELDAHYLNLENQYLTSLYNYNNLLDGGSTDVLLDKLLDSWEGDIWDLRQSYLAESPYLSPEVLIELALSEKLPLPIYLEIALSNPEATQKDEYIEFMEKPETITLLTVSGIDLIKGSWNNRTFRATMESNISSKLTSMEDVSRTKISRIINDTNGYNITNYRNEINKIRNIEAKYELVESYIETSDYILARNILNSLLEDPVYSKYNEEGINDYLLLLEILEDRDSITNQIIIDNRLIDLSQLPSRAGAKARAYLNFYDDNTNYHPVLIAEPSNKSKAIRVKPNINNMFDANIKLSPNPAKDYITFTYDLPPKNIYTVSIYDSKGKEVIVKKLNSNKGVQSIELKNLRSGAYYYTIKDNNKVIKTDKIIVVK
ncbi:MAG: T9SS type A sorting domain-containing protein [Bacteroidales bacterium]